MSERSTSADDEIVQEISEIVEDPQPGLSPEEAVSIRRRALLRRFWHSASRYWRKDGGRLAWVLTGSLLLVVLLNLAAAYGMNVWNRAIFDALEKHDGAHGALDLDALFSRCWRQASASRSRRSTPA